MKDKEKQIKENGKELYNDLSSIMEEEYENRKLITPNFCANKLLEKGYRKIDKDSVVLSKEELSKRDYEFRQIGYDECLRDNPKKDKYIKTLERKIDQLNAKLDQASKETAEKILKFLKEHLSCMGFSIVKAYFKEQFDVEIKE